ncbi:hypothetical protein LguiB_000401 [Lonicera macranthoides]
MPSTLSSNYIQYAREGTGFKSHAAIESKIQDGGIGQESILAVNFSASFNLISTI